MPEVCGFQGLRFDAAVCGDLSNCITPPYDVIDSEERARLASLSPHNMVHLILPEADSGQDKYENAAHNLNTWREYGALQQDSENSIYLLRQAFTDLEGNACVRRGFFAVIKIPEQNEHYVLGHERTFDKPVADRLALTAATRSNLGPVFVLYSDEECALSHLHESMEELSPDYAANTSDGVKQELWRRKFPPEVTEFFQDKILYIADGHHRFQTACTYRDHMRKETGITDGQQAWDYVLMGFVAFNDAGLKIYPPHRLVDASASFDAEAFLSRLGEFFDVAQVDDRLPDAVESAPGECVMGVAIANKGDYLLTLKDIDRTTLLGDDRAPAWRALDVAVLHRGILERILGLDEVAVHAYEKNVDAAMDAAHSGRKALAFILKSTPAEQIRACADAGERMPQKATYFFPKLPTGAVIYSHE